MSVSSVEKTLKYLQCVSSADTVVKYEDVELRMTKKRAIYIYETFWHKDYCNCCGQCCRNYNTVFSENEFKFMKENFKDLAHSEIVNELAQEKIINVDGLDYRFYEVPAMKLHEGHDVWVTSHTVRNCRFIDLQPDGVTKYCTIHNYRPITCGFPHMELRLNRAETGIPTLRHIQFGRNHMLQCNVDLSLPYDEATHKKDLYWLHRLDDFAKEYHIPTFLSKIINYIEGVDWRNPPKQNIIIQNSGTRSLL